MNEHIRQITETTWSSVLGLDIQGSAVPMGQPPGPHVTACVQISGAWEGTVIFYCGQPLASRIGEAMFGLEPGAVSDEEVRDAIGELANIIAGALKEYIPRPAQLGLPTVVVGENFHVSVPGGMTTDTVTHTCDGDPFEVLVVRRGSAAGSVAASNAAPPETAAA